MKVEKQFSQWITKIVIVIVGIIKLPSYLINNIIIALSLIVLLFEDFQIGHLKKFYPNRCHLAIVIPSAFIGRDGLFDKIRIFLADLANSVFLDTFI